MNQKQQLIREIEQASAEQVAEVLKFLLALKQNSQKNGSEADTEQLREMSEDPQIRAEIADINREFSVTEMDGLD